MKIRYPVIAIIIMIILMIILEPLSYTHLFTIHQMIIEILLVLQLVCLGLIVYLIIRNIFRAIKGQVTKPSRIEPEADILRSEVERLSKRVEELEKDR